MTNLGMFRFLRHLLVAGICVLLANCQSMTTTISDQQSMMASLSGLRLQVPCADHFNQRTECHWDKSLLQIEDPRWKLKKELVRTFAGKPGKIYDVALHVRGVVEPKNYIGGTVQFDHFQTGGDAVKNDYNVYSLSVSDPAAIYVMNRNEEKVGHYTFIIDYRVTIPVRGGATVTMGSYDSNDVAIANHEHHIVDGLTDLQQPFDGQFFDIQVESIKVRN